MVIHKGFFFPGSLAISVHDDAYEHIMYQKMNDGNVTTIKRRTATNGGGNTPFNTKKNIKWDEFKI